ncbi:MAG: CoA transferase subunit A [Bacteroidetes bacterium]|nr:CoA transferase subunit A [Bacteroidota bacterium]MCL2303626.1 CoA transferase subunit A [Lentimicrobiaceae bacterium]
MQKPILTPAQAVTKIKSGMTLMIGGFLAAGSPIKILKALAESDVHDLTIICNDTAFPDKGIGLLIAAKKVKKVIASHIGTNPLTVEQFNNKETEVVFVPQGTLAEQVRCGGSGLGGVLTPTGLGTMVAEGKQIITLDGKEYLLEKALRGDIALVGANIGDTAGNLYYKGTTQNFNPLMAMACDTVIAEVEELVPAGEIPMENVHTQGILVDFLVKI